MVLFFHVFAQFSLKSLYWRDALQCSQLLRTSLKINYPNPDPNSQALHADEPVSVDSLRIQGLTVSTCRYLPGCGAECDCTDECRVH